MSPQPDALPHRCIYTQCTYILNKTTTKEAFVTTSAAAGKQQEIKLKIKKLAVRYFYSVILPCDPVASTRYVLGLN